MCAEDMAMTGKDAALCAKNATMCAKDAAMCAKDAAMCAEDPGMCAKDAARPRPCGPCAPRTSPSLYCLIGPRQLTPTHANSRQLTPYCLLHNRA